MGADIYLMSDYKKCKIKYEKKFEKAVAERNAMVDKESEEYKKKQEEVGEWYDKMYSKGYFRDSYNDSNLLWLFDMSWWDFIGKHQDKKGNLTPTKIKLFLKELKDNEALFKENIKGKSKEDREYFLEKYEELKKLCNEAIAKKEPLECSV